MKLHLPLALLRPLLQHKKAVARTLLGLGALCVIPASEITLNWMSQETIEWEHERIKRENREKHTIAKHWGKEEFSSDSFLMECLLSVPEYEQAAAQAYTLPGTPRTLASITLANLAGFTDHGGGGALVVPQPQLTPTGKKPAIQNTLLLTAGITPLQNYVAHGPGKPASTSSSTGSTSSSGSSSQVSSPPAAPVAAAPRGSKLRSARMRSFSLMAAPDDSPAPVAEEPWTGLTWVGDKSDAWDNTQIRNWKNASGQEDYFSASDSTRNAVLFDDSGRNKAINVTVAQQAENMKVTGSGYSFTGGGNITIADTLTIAFHNPGKDANGKPLPGTLSFGQANNIDAGSIIGQSSTATTTTFNGSVTADTVTLQNCPHAENMNTGGKYVFNNNLTISGTLTADIDTTSDDFGTDGQTHLTVKGALSAGEIVLGGSSNKLFSGNVTTLKNPSASGTTSGDLTISVYDAPTGNSLDGTTTFTRDVSLAGGLFILNNSEAIFRGGLTSSAAGGLQVTLNQGKLSYEADTRHSGGDTYSLGTITLEGLGTLGAGKITQVDARVIANGHDFVVSGESQRVDISLEGSNAGNFTVNGGNVNLATGDASRINGTLAVDGLATLHLQNANVFADNGNGGISVSNGGHLDLGSYQQTLRGNISLANGSIGGAEGSKLVASGSHTLNFSGSGNRVSTTLELGNNNLTVKGSGNGSLTLHGDIYGGAASGYTATGTLTFTGTQLGTDATGKMIYDAGTTSISENLSHFTGNVVIENGATVRLESAHALGEAHKVTVGTGSTLSILHTGTSTCIHGNGDWNEEFSMGMGLELMDGATLTFTNLSGHKDTPALTLEGGLLINGNVTFNFLEQDAEGNNTGKLENLQTYELITSKSGINSSAQSGGGVHVYANGRTEELDSSQYQFGFYIDDNDVRHFTLTMLVGRVWQNAEGGEWHEQDPANSGNYINWSTGAVGDTALFRTMTNAETGALVEDVAITYSAPSGALSLYMDGATNYSITSLLADGTQAFVQTSSTEENKPLSSPRFIKRGEGSMTWNGFTATLGQVDIEQGTFAMADGSTLSTTNTITISDVSYVTPEDGSAASKDYTATLSIAGDSRLLQGEATLTGSSAGAAQLHGVTISGNSIAAYHSGLSGTDDANLAHYIQNAVLGVSSETAVNGFHLSGKDADCTLELRGKGSLAHTTLGEHVSIAEGAEYSLGKNITFESTVTNHGTVSVGTDTVLGIGGLAGALGESSVYTIFNNIGENASVEGWTGLTAGNVRLNGIDISKVSKPKDAIGNYSITVTPKIEGSQAQIQVDTVGLAFINWDSEWSRYKESSTAPILAVNYTSDSNVSASNPAYQYGAWISDNTFNNVYVLNLSEASGSSAKVLGFGTNLSSSPTSPKDLWVNSEGSQFTTYVGGTASDIVTYYGDTHLQMLGEHQYAYCIVGGSNRSSQVGDSFLTFAAGSDPQEEIDYTDNALAAAGSSGGKASKAGKEDEVSYYSPLTVVAGNYGNLGLYIEFYDQKGQKVDVTLSSVKHVGNSFLHIAAGRFGIAYAGSHETYTEGTTRALIDGGAIAILHGGDFSSDIVSTYWGWDYNTNQLIEREMFASGDTTHTGNVEILLKGGKLSTVYAAGGIGWNETSEEYKENKNKVDGNATISLYAAEGTMLSSFRDDSVSYFDGEAWEESTLQTKPLLYGGKSVSVDGELIDYVSGTSTLEFANAGTYHLESYKDANGNSVTDENGKAVGVEIAHFDNFSVAEGAHAIIAADKFNVTNALTISGKGKVEIVGANSTAHDVTLNPGVTLHINTNDYSDTDTRSAIIVHDGAGIHVSPGEENNPEGRNNVTLTLAGDGADGKGALYKLSGATSPMVAFPSITLTGNASMGAASGAMLHILDGEVVTSGTETTTQYKDTYIDLTNGGAGGSDAAGSGSWGYVLTKSGEGTLNLYNTNVTGGTINVVSGKLEVAYSSVARNTDLVLQDGTGLEFMQHANGTDPDTNATSDYNGFAIETLSGSGTVQLNQNGWLYISHDRGRTTFDDDYSNEATEYAHFSGNILSTGNDARVSKMGGGTQWFEGSSSTYGGGTTVEGGILYLTGTSTATAGSFAKATQGADNQMSATTKVEMGVIGTGELKWDGGAVYLGDGVRIFNAGKTLNNARMDIGVDAVETRDEDGNITSVTYNEATYSGVLNSDGTGGMAKLGAGTLNVDQRGYFTGGTSILGGTLNLYGWAAASDASITQVAGSTLMFSYDGTYTGESAAETVNANTPFVLTGTGDERWMTAQRTDSAGRTAALISNIGAAKTLTLEGVISAGTEDGNLMHSGEGTLVLTGANSYSGGTAVLRGTLEVKNTTGSAAANGEAQNTALGKTADGKLANLVAAEAATIKFAEHESISVNTTTLAATATDIQGNATGYEGNSIHGVVFIGTENEKTAKLVMKGDGYNASRTELGLNDVLVFDDRSSSNWDGLLNTDKTTPLTPGDMAGAGILAGDTGSKVVVTDATTRYGDAARTRVYFQVTDALTGAVAEDALNGEDNTNASALVGGYKGDLVVEGEQALLHIQGGAITGGNYEVSGTGARLDAARSLIVVDSGKHITLTSRGDEDADHDSTATLAAYRVEVRQGGTLAAATAETTFGYTTAKEQIDLIDLPLEAAIRSYPYNGNWDRTSIYAKNVELPTYQYSWHFDERIALNTRTAATLETSGGLTLLGGSIYESRDSNTSLGGTKLTLDVSNGNKIILTGEGSYRDEGGIVQNVTFNGADGYLRKLSTAGDADQTRQWVLFTDVSAFEVLNGDNSLSGLSLSLDPDVDPKAPANRLYVAYAGDVFSDTESSLIPENVLLVYDAGAQVVYLDRIPNLTPPEMPEVPFTPPRVIPEPATATLSLLGLAALAARRRRR